MRPQYAVHLGERPGEIPFAEDVEEAVLRCHIDGTVLKWQRERVTLAQIDKVRPEPVLSENLIRWIRSRKENRIMIETDGDLLQTSARIYVGLLSFA